MPKKCSLLKKVVQVEPVERHHERNEDRQVVRQTREDPEPGEREGPHSFQRMHREGAERSGRFELVVCAVNQREQVPGEL